MATVRTGTAAKSVPKYRRYKEEKSRRVFTIAHESRHLIVENVPRLLRLSSELLSLFALYGDIDHHALIEDGPVEKDELLESHRITFKNIEDARVAKRKMNKSGFYGEVLSVKYAPEFETVLETRAKLENRRVAIQFLGSLSLQRLPKIKGAPEALQSQSSSHLDAAVWFREPFLDDRLSHLSTSARHFPEDQRASSSSSSSSSSSASPSPSSVLVKRPRSFETNTAARSVDQTLQNVRNKLRKLHDQ